MLHPSITNQLTQGCKMSQIKPFLEILAQQHKLGNLKKLSTYKRAKRLLLISINQN